MTHRSADDLSDSIDRWLSQEAGAASFHLADVVEALSDALPTLADDSSRERVRRVVVVGTVALAVWLRRRGLSESIAPA